MITKLVVYGIRITYYSTLFMWASYWLHTWAKVDGAGAVSSISIAATKFLTNASGLLEGRISVFFSDGLAGIIVFSWAALILLGAILYDGEKDAPKRKQSEDDDDYDPYYYEDPGIGEEIGGSPHYRH